MSYDNKGRIPVYDAYDDEDDDYIREMPNSVYKLELATERWLGFALGIGLGGLAGGIVWGLYFMV